MAERIEYNLEVIDGFMRPIFEGKSQEWTELMWDVLLPFPASAAALLTDMQDVEQSGMGAWSFEIPTTRVTCTPQTLLVQEILEEGAGREPLRIELPLTEAISLMERWLFECVWREQQRRGQAEKQ